MKKNPKRLFSALCVVALAMMLQGCGDEKGSGSSTRPEDPIKLIVSFAGRLDAPIPGQGAVLAVRNVAQDGTLSQPFASLSQFTSSDFLFYNQSVELLKKNCFYVELRDKEPMGKLFWNLRKGYSNVGLVDRNSTFLSDSMLKYMKAKKVAPKEISFFIERAGGEKVPALEEYRKNGRVEELEDSFGKILEMWIATKDLNLMFPWGVVSKKKDAERGKELARIIVLALAMEEGGRESARWLPVVYGGFESGFMDIAADEVSGAEWNVERVRIANALFFFLRDEFPKPKETAVEKVAGESSEKLEEKIVEKAPDAPVEQAADGNDNESSDTIANNPPTKLPQPAQKIEKKSTLRETIDTVFSASVLSDANYDLRRKIDYLADETKSRAGYDLSKGAGENFGKFVITYSAAVKKAGQENKMDESLAVAPEEFDAFMEKAREQARTILEKMRKNGKGPVMFVR